VPAERIAENLAFINWTVLAALAVGTFGAVVAGRLLTRATTGYLGFTALTAGAFAALAAMSDGALATASPAALVVGDPALDVPRRIALWALALIALVYGIALLRGARAPALGLAGLGAGIAGLVLGAAAWGGPGIGPLLLLAQLVLLAGATGGVWAAMILGHWYLVTPKLSEVPLVLFSRALAAVVAIQIVAFVAWMATGAGPGAAAGFAGLTGPWALFVWLRLVVGLVFPAVVSWAAIQTARSRSMESATGLLYINVGTIAAGTILAAGLYFGAGILA
jgi:hypothetical protein